MPNTETQNGVYKVQVMDRAVAILDVLAANGSELSLGDLTEALQLHKSTVHRLLMVLESYRFVDKNPLTGRYRLGMRLFELGSKAVANLNLRDRARLKLERLAFETNETVHLCVMDHGEMLYLDKVEPQRSVRLASSVGRRISAHCSGVGKAMLAYMEEGKVREILRKSGLPSITKNTITTPAVLRVELQKIHERGYAVDNEENEEGVRCIAAPIFDYSGQAVAAVSISGPTFRLGQSQVPSLAKIVLGIAAEISQELGAPAQSRAAAR